MIGGTMLGIVASVVDLCDGFCGDEVVVSAMRSAIGGLIGPGIRR